MVSRPVKVVMRDGVKLAGDLFLPGAEGRFPTLVRKTPYPRSRSAEHDAFYATQGYAVLAVSFRGRFGSEGSYGRFQAENEGWFEHPDGYDTIEWAAVQEWSSGMVGTFGVSSDAMWQIFTAPTQPPHLRAMLISYPAHPRHGRVEGGVHTSTGLTWHATFDAFARPLNSVGAWREWLSDWQGSHMPIGMSFLNPELLNQFVRTGLDSYWDEIDPANQYARMTVPILHECGWYDRYVSHTLQNFTGVRSGSDSSEARAMQQVVIGPWLHAGLLPQENDTFKWGPAATPDRHRLHLRWFGHWLKGEETGIRRDPPVRVYVIGSEKWLETTEWPIADTQPRILYLRAGLGPSDVSLNTGMLSLTAPQMEDPDRYRHDPYNPIPSIGHHGGLTRMWPGGPEDNRPAEVLSLTYTSDVLRDNLKVIGSPSVRFFAASSAVDTDFVATITDVFPNGYSAVLRQNAIRARYRAGERATDEQLLEPGSVSEYRINFDPIANMFGTGHRIRLQIASSSFPAYLPNPGVASPYHLATEAVVTDNAVYHDAEHLSYIELPVVAGSR